MAFYVSELINIVRPEKLPKEVRIFDTTLRDGEQTPGVSLTVEDKLTIARQLDKLGVDTIEAGMPITSRGEKEAVKLIAKEGLDSEIIALARVDKKDIDIALECDVDAIHTFVATSDLHLEHKLRITREEAKEQAIWAVEYAKSHGVTVEFSAEDATRTDIAFLKDVFLAVQEAGADRVDVPDTVGVITPRAMFYLINEINETIDIPIAVHCHNDFGLATANSLASVEAGCEEVHVCVNGLGERAGNASLEEVVTSLYALYDVKTNINLRYLVETSDLVEMLTGISLPPCSPIVGDNAFAHESGIHVHGVLGKSFTYEPITPEMVGHKREIVIGKHTGTHSVDKWLDDFGISVTKEQLKDIVNRVKEVGDKGKKVTDVDLRTIAETVIGEVAKEKRTLEMRDLSVMTGSQMIPTASVRLVFEGEEKIASETGVGPVDAAINAIRSAIGAKFIKLNEYRLKAITGGSDALAEVMIKVEDDKGNIASAKGAREDIVMASVDAMIEGINKLMLLRKKRNSF